MHVTVSYWGGVWGLDYRRHWRLRAIAIAPSAYYAVGDVDHTTGVSVEAAGAPRELNKRGGRIN